LESAKGALVVGLKPAQTAAFADIMRVMEPNALVTVFGFSATYPGTRPGAAKAGPAKLAAVAPQKPVLQGFSSEFSTP